MNRRHGRSRRIGNLCESCAEHGPSGKAGEGGIQLGIRKLRHIKYYRACNTAEASPRIERSTLEGNKLGDSQLKCQFQIARITRTTSPLPAGGHGF